MLRSLPLVLALAVVAPAPEFSTDYTREVSWLVTTELELSRTAGFSTEVDGRPVEGRPGMPGMSAEETRTVEQVLRVLEHADGRPTRVRRGFEEVGGNVAGTFGERGVDRELESRFEGAVFEIRVEEDETPVEVLEGDVDPEDARRFGLDLALDALLPPGAVEEGETWELAGGGVARALGLDVQEALFPPAPPVEDVEQGRRGRGGFGRRGASAVRLLAGLDWEGEGTLVSAREESEDGPVARIRFRAEGDGDLAVLLEPRGGGFGRGGETEGDVEAEVEGELVFSLEERRPVSLEAEGTFRVQSRRTMARRDREFTIETSEEGRLSVRSRVEPSGD